MDSWLTINSKWFVLNCPQRLGRAQQKPRGMAEFPWCSRQGLQMCVKSKGLCACRETAAAADTSVPTLRVWNGSLCTRSDAQINWFRTAPASSQVRKATGEQRTVTSCPIIKQTARREMETNNTKLWVHSLKRKESVFYTDGWACSITLMKHYILHSVLYVDLWCQRPWT